MKKVAFIIGRGIAAALAESASLATLMPVAFEAVGLLVRSTHSEVFEHDLGKFATKGEFREYCAITGKYHPSVRELFKKSSRVQVVFGLYPDHNPCLYSRNILGVRVLFYDGKSELGNLRCACHKDIPFSVLGGLGTHT